MKILLLTFSLNFILAGFSLSQTYYPLVKENVYWDVLEGNSQNNYIYDNGYRFFFEGDTVVNNISYKKLKYHPLVIEYNPFPSFEGIDTTVVYTQYFIREDTLTRKTYILDDWNGNGITETLLFDFSLHIGDTLYSSYAGDGGILVIDTITNIPLLDGTVRRMWHLTNGHHYIEGVGGSQGFFFQTITGLGFWFEENCVNDGGVHLLGNQCFTVLNIGVIKIDNKILLYPNPSSNYLNVHYYNPSPQEDLSFRVLDVRGRLLKEYKTYDQSDKTYILPVYDLEAGVYILELRQEGALIGSEEFVKR